jgi:lipid A 3-O-deacylase
MPLFHRRAALAAAACALAASPALADELYLGASAHAVETPFTLETGEHGRDLQFGYRSDGIEGLKAIGSPSVYVHGQASLNGETSLAAVGLSWKIGDKVYLRPGIGLALHTDRMPAVGADGTRLDLGSRLLFEPEIALGARLGKRVSAEFSWVHVSHATLLSGQNPGMDFIGARLVLQL